MKEKKKYTAKTKYFYILLFCYIVTFVLNSWDVDASGTGHIDLGFLKTLHGLIV
jgi:hypothetical protein